MKDSVVDFYLIAVERATKYKDALMDILEICQLEPPDEKSIELIADRVRDALDLTPQKK